MTTTYPQADTKAEVILGHIRDNPGVTRNAIITGLKLNPAVVRKCITALLDHELIEDAPDDRGHHHYSAKGIL